MTPAAEIAQPDQFAVMALQAKLRSGLSNAQCHNTLLDAAKTRILCTRLAYQRISDPASDKVSESKL
jgi:hypothetical protein